MSARGIGGPPFLVLSLSMAEVSWPSGSLLMVVFFIKPGNSRSRGVMGTQKRKFDVDLLSASLTTQVAVLLQEPGDMEYTAIV